MPEVPGDEPESSHPESGQAGEDIKIHRHDAGHEQETNEEDK